MRRGCELSPVWAVSCGCCSASPGRSSGAPAPRAWFYDAAANFALNRLGRADSSARRTIETDDAHVFPRAEYILGMALARKRDLEPQGAFAPTARQRLAEIQAAGNQ
ncbi:MAG: hypothetical protein ABSH47_16315 [Bryobacteraceae bacterium]